MNNTRVCSLGTVVLLRGSLPRLLLKHAPSHDDKYHDTYTLRGILGVLKHFLTNTAVARAYAHGRLLPVSAEYVYPRLRTHTLRAVVCTCSAYKRYLVLLRGKAHAIYTYAANIRMRTSSKADPRVTNQETLRSCTGQALAIDTRTPNSDEGKGWVLCAPSGTHTPHPRLGRGKGVGQILKRSGNHEMTTSKSTNHTHDNTPSNTPHDGDVGTASSHRSFKTSVSR